MLRAPFFAGACLAWLGTCAQNMVAGEYWVDSDPGWGQCTAITGMPVQPDVGGHPFQVPTGTLAPGLHVLGIRTKDANGRWGLTDVRPVHISAAPQNADITRTVYFWNTDGGWGGGTDAGIDGAPQVSNTVTVSMAGTVAGLNLLFTRSQDAAGRWGLTNAAPVYLDHADADAPIVRTEYFLNSDPGWGGGLDANVDGAAEIPATVTAADLSDAAPGLNTLFYRSLDAHGHWSLTNRLPLLAEGAPSGEVTGAETFWDEDPGFGMGMPVPNWTSGTDVSGQFSVMVPINIGWGMHKLYVRTRDAHGHWSLTNWKTDSVDVIGTTGMDELAARTGISTWPNPFTEGITVRTPDGLPVRVIIYDPQGKLVHDEVVNGEATIDLSRHASGTYTAFFWKDLERMHRVQLVKQ